MRPDLEDYDELNMGGDSGRTRAMSWLVLLIAIGGFTSLAYYAYKSGSQAMRESTVTVVNADETPIKTVPVDPQGEQFPNKDKTIYDAISKDGKPKNVEKLLAEPERPIVVGSGNDVLASNMDESEKSGATTYVNVANKATDPVDAQLTKNASENTSVTISLPPKIEVKKSEVADAVKPSSNAKEPEQSPVKSVEAPEMVNVKPVTIASQPTSEEKDTKAKSEPQAAKVVVKTEGAYKIQLGAYQSESEAAAMWKRISAKHADVVSGAPIIVKADTAKGTFYRLRASGFASMDAAKAACGKLSARSQACFAVGK